MTASRIVIAAFVGLCGVAAFGQNPPAATGTTDPTATTPNGRPTGAPVNGARDPRQAPGARNNQVGGKTTRDLNGDGKDAKDTKENTDENELTPREGPDIIDDPNATPEQKASAEYSGPAVLSRGIAASVPMNPKNTKFTPSIGLEYVVNSGLTGVVLQDGKLADKLSSGIMLTYGLTGEKVFKRDTFSLAFTGNLNHYVQASNYDGSSDELAFTWRHKLSRHLSFGIRESASVFNNNNLLLSGSQLINSGVGTTLVTAAPATEAFDGRVITFFNEGDLTWQLSGRLSINLSGAGFLTRRASDSLYGSTGYQSGGDIAYRITRRTTTGVYYQYTHFDFTGIYGGTDVNTVGLTYSVAFNPRTQLISRVGGSRLETTGLQSFELSPILALLLGTPQSIQAVYVKNYTPDFNIQFRRQLSNLDFSAAYARGVTPGNGVILTSVRQSATLGANYKVRRHWNVGVTSGYDTLSGFGVTNQKYASVFVGSSVYRKLAKQIDWHARFDFHHYTFDNTGFLRNSSVFSTGISWSPGDILERLW